MKCSDCNGTGRITLLTSVSPCERCKGQGVLWDAPVNSATYPASDFSAIKIESVPDGEGGYRIAQTFIVEGVDE